jgi:hypothetical protein
MCKDQPRSQIVSSSSFSHFIDYIVKLIKSLTPTDESVKEHPHDLHQPGSARTSRLSHLWLQS